MSLICAGFLAALLGRDDLVAALQAAGGAAEAEAGSTFAAALDLAEEAGLNRKGLERLLAEEATAAATMKQHSHLAR